MRSEYVPQITGPTGVLGSNKLEKHLILHLIYSMPSSLPQEVGNRHQHTEGSVSSAVMKSINFL